MLNVLLLKVFDLICFIILYYIWNDNDNHTTDNTNNTNDY